jgi:hypothetical protein
MRFAKGKDAVSWEFFEAMAREFRAWRALHPYADPRILAETLKKQAESNVAGGIAPDVPQQ